jgi:hypothetical protein
VLLDILLAVQVIGMAGLVIIAGFVEGYGYGLSLGTRWPYHEKILVLAMKADPEAWHRIVATILGLVGVALVILAPGANTITGLALIVVTAVLGMATLHVLAGRWPAFLQGLHGLLAYSTYITYLLALKPDAPPVWDYLKVMAPLHPFLVMIFLGGVTTGSRGYQRAIGGFKVPRSKGQWAFSLHYVFGLIFLLTLGYYSHTYSGPSCSPWRSSFSASCCSMPSTTTPSGPASWWSSTRAWRC